MTRTLMIVGTFVLTVGSGHSADWKPAPAPLMTKWAQDVTPDKVLPEYPRPQMAREKWLNLNGLWQLAFAKEGEGPPVGENLPERILVPFPVESALSGVGKHADRLWYRRTFTVPKEWSGKRVLLHFGAVDWETKVWVNGQPVGEHRGGYDPFSFEITDFLKKEGQQELIVGVYDPTDAGPQPRGKQVLKPGGIYYTPTTGIWQTVWLEPVAESSIEALKIAPDVDGKRVRVTVSLRGNVKGTKLEVESREKASWFIENVSSTARTLTGSVETVTIPMYWDVRLWSPEDPFLYGLRLKLSRGAETLDSVESYFAMRKIEIGKDDKGITRLLLNGKPYFQVGPLDQGFWPDGLYTAPTDAALKFDVEMTKKLGFNMTRKHVKVEPARWYYWCDKLGLLVWQDMPSGDKSVARGKGEITRTPEAAKQFEAELKAMIDSLHNHPSIVMWVVFNEGWGQYDTERITKWAKQYDPARLVNCASGWNDMKVGDVHDIHVYPGPGSPDPEPARAAVLGEFGGLGLGVDGHTWTDKNWSYSGTRSKADLTRRYENLLRGVYKLKEEKGLSAAVYTQITDVETEINGLLTYDRAVVKVDLERVAAANRGDFSRAPELVTVVATAKSKGVPWRYTLEKPGDAWFKPDFDATSWKEGAAGFGTKGTPGAVIGTEWKTADIWLRREFTLPEKIPAGLHLTIHHDEDAEVYVNGVLAAKLTRFTTDYVEVPISEEAHKALKPGKNLFAVHCKQTGGGQYIDVGLVEVREPKP